jgi:phosphoserine phosphatase
VVELLIATFIAAGQLAGHQIGAVAALLKGRGFSGERAWVEPGRAMDFRFDHPVTDARAVLDAVEGALPGVDVVVQEEAYRRKRLLIADMDSTMITVECIDELADFAGLKPQVAAVTEAAMRGELPFEAALEARVALLAGLDEQAIDQCREDRVRLTPGARHLVRTMRARGAYTLLVSGGFTRFAEPVAEQIGFDRAMANVLIVEDGKLTGAVRRPYVGAEAKREALLAAAAELGIGLEWALAVGDGANDLPMVEAAGLGVAFRAKPVLAQAADARVDHNDLTALLYAQGIPRAQWVED